MYDKDTVPQTWPMLSSSLDYSCRIFNIRTDLALSPRTGHKHEFFILECTAWVNIIPVTRDKQVVLIRQYRHGIQDNTLEVPGGLVEDFDTPESAAVRELREETGYRPGQVSYLGRVHPNPAIQNNECHSFLALNVEPVWTQELDSKEDIQVLLRPLSALPDLLRQGHISHSLVLAAFQLYFLQYPRDLQT